MSLEAVRIRIIKRFQFPELVFAPQALKEEFRYLNDPAWHAKFEEANPLPTFPIGDSFELRPIANPQTKDEMFWLPFTIMDDTFKNTSKNFKGLALPLFPAMIGFQQPTIDKSEFEKRLTMQLKDFQLNFHARLFPPGIVDAHVDLYMRFAEAQENLSKLQKIIPVLKLIPVYDASGHKHKGVLNAIDQIMQSLFTILCESNHTMSRATPGYYACFLLQDGYLNWEDHLRDLALLLLRRDQPERTELRIANNKVLSAVTNINPATDDLFVIGKQNHSM